MKPVVSILEKQSAGWFFVFGLGLTLWAASGGMNMTMAAIDKAYDVEKGRPFWKQRLYAVVLTIVVATLVILVMILLPIGAGVLTWLIRKQAIFPWLYVLVNVARYALALLLLLAVLAIIYHFAPSFKQKFVAVTPGAVFCVAVWLLLGAAFRLYLTKLGGAANYNKTYGAVAGAAILLLFFYLDALVLLIGAEINSEIDFATGQALHRQQRTPLRAGAGSSGDICTGPG
jgi:membrane protein